MTKQENTEEFKSDWRCVHPLSLLTRCDTEEARWDYHSDINKDKVVNETDLAQFYFARLPETVYSVVSLEQWVKENGEEKKKISCKDAG